MTQPTAQDIQNAETRRQISERMAQEYGECLRWALGAFGPGWVPSCRHHLVAKEEEERARSTGDRPQAAATVYTVRHQETGAKRHFAVEDGRVVEHASYEAGFGPMLLEPHPTRGFEYQGQWRRTHRYSLCWAGYELYQPRTAEELAEARGKRERKAVEKDAQAYPLYADQIRDGELRVAKRPRGRG